MAETILITEDEKHIAGLLKVLLESKGYTTYHAPDGNTALKLASAIKPDLVLLDVMLPNKDGYEVLNLMKENPELKDIPVIFVTVNTETTSKVVGLRMGGYDYITKPFDIEELLARVESALRIKNIQDDLRAQNQRLSEMSVTDPLTGLYNRRFMMERLNEELERAKRYHYPVACIMIDIDNFKEINDQYGHLQGDQALQQMALLLKNSSRVVDIIVRYGGEEFLQILPQTDLGGAKVVGERFRKLVEQNRFVTDAPEKIITVSLGASAYITNHIHSMEKFLKLADDALYLAKQQGKNQLVLAPYDTNEDDEHHD